MHGAKNPVPLAKVYGSGSEAAPAVDFTDGITRTLWLLVNGAPAFPVECRRQKAEALSCAAGVDWAQWLTVQDLTGDLSWSDWLHSAHLLTPEKPEGAG